MVSLSTVAYAAVGTAWKTPNMRGFVYKKGKASGTAEGSFRLAFRNTDIPPGTETLPGDGTGADTFDDAIFTFTPDGAGGYNVSTSSNLTLDALLLKLMMSDDWRQGTFTAYNSQLTSGEPLW